MITIFLVWFIFLNLLNSFLKLMELSAALRTGGQEWMAATARITCELPWETERLCESPAGTRVPPGTSQTLSCTTTFRAFMQRSTTKDTTFCLNLSVIWGVTGGQVETSTLDSYLCMLRVVMQTEQGLIRRYQNRNNSSYYLRRRNKL